MITEKNIKKKSNDSECLKLCQIKKVLIEDWKMVFRQLFI